MQNNENKLEKNKTNEIIQPLLGKKSKKTNRFIIDAINLFKSGDDMTALTTLYDLTTQLSMANDTLAEDPNCYSLIKELILLFDKYFLPDITLYSLQCLNYLLDLNPIFTSTIQQQGGIPKIVLMTQNIEFIDLAENAIKAIEKISTENPQALLESDAFVNLLNFIEFFDNNIKKSALRACLNITYSVNSLEKFKRYMIPGIPSLTCLSKINQNEISINSLAIQCFHSILTNIKMYNLNRDESVENSLIQYGMLENIYEITLIYINSTNGKTIGTDVFRNILKIYQILCGLNSAASVLLNMNILEIVYCLLRSEIGDVEEIEMVRKMSDRDESMSDNYYKKEESNKIINVNVSNKSLNNFMNNSNTYSGHTFLNEIFSILMALFPSVKTEGINNLDKDSNLNVNESKEKILSPSNKIFYNYFADKILKLLLSKILSISSCSTLIQIVKLLSVFFNFSTTEQIVNYIEAEKLSDIVAKLLDNKDTYYLSEVLTLIEIIMKKVPEHFIVYFMREGIVENLKAFKLEKLEKIEKLIEQSNTEKLGNDTTKPILDHIGMEEDLEEYSDDECMLDNNNDNYNYEYQSEELSLKESPEDNYQSELEKAIEISKNINEEVSKEIMNNREKNNEEIRHIIIDSKDNKNISNDFSGNYNNKEGFINITNQLELINVVNEKEKLSDYINIDFKKKETDKLNIIKANSNHLLTEKPTLDYHNNLKDPEIKKDKAYNSISAAKKNVELDTGKKLINSYANQYPELEMLQTLRKRLENLVQTFFTEEKIGEFLNKIKNLTSNPMDIFNSLQNYKNEIVSIIENQETNGITNNIDQFPRCIEILKKVIQIILNKESPLTLWEMEKSVILITISKFLDGNFCEIWHDNIEDPNEILVINSKNSKNKKIISKKSLDNNKTYYTNLNLIQRLKAFFSCLDNDIDKILRFVNILQQTITKMNCFTIFFNENNMNYNLTNLTNTLASKLYRNAYKEAKKYRIKFLYDGTDFEKKFSEELKNSNLNLNFDKSQLDKILEINDYLVKKKEYVITVTSDEKFSDIDSIFKDDLIFLNEKFLMKKSFKKTENTDKENKTNEINTITNTNSNFNLNDFISHKMNFNFFLSFEVKGEKKFFTIEKNWTTNDVLENLKKKFSKDEITQFLLDLPIIYELKLKPKANLENQSQEKINMHPNQNKEIITTESNLKIDTDDDLVYSEIFKTKEKNSEANILTQISEKIFTKFYNKNIVLNKNLYQIKRLSPSLFLIALIDLSLQFTSLFEINLIKSPEYDEKLAITFENQKVSSLLLKQLRDPSAISYGSIPSWCKSLPENFTFISNFNSRYLLFKTCSFDSKRGLINLHNYLKKFSGEITLDNSNNSINISKNSRYKVIVERNEILAYANKLMKENSGYNGFVEFEYLNETGTGLGPTLEFYSLVIEKLTLNKSLWYKNSTNNKLYPAPLKENTENLEIFTLLGFIIARALYDDRLIDIPLSPIFWNLLLDKPISLECLYEVDANLANTIVRDFKEIIEVKKNFLLLPENSKYTEQYLDPENDIFDLGDKIKYNNTRIDELAILFNLPGYPEIELMSNGLETLLTIHNIEDYVNGIYDKLFGSGVKSILKAFKTGFNLVFDVDNLKCFHAKEIEESLCGSSEMVWDFDTLYEHVRPDHGYDKASRIYKFLLRFMSELDRKSKRNFLTFVTGSPRLPVGGFKSLIPKLTVVKAISHYPPEKIDNILPTVMTCQNYLKIPEYSSYEILRDRLTTAIKEGLNAFLFS